MYKFYLRPISRIWIILALIFASSTVMGQNISINLKKVKFEKALDQIKNKSGYRFIYNAKTLEGTKEVTVNLKNTSFKEVLKAVFAGQPVTYTISADVIVIRRIDDASNPVVPVPQASTGKITGYIYDADGLPLQGATVTLEDELTVSETAITDSKGFFILNAAPADQNLIVSYIGYTRESIPVANKSSFTLTLKLESVQMKEVLISTGYQKLSKERITGAADKPDMNVFKQRSGTMDVINRLEGLVPGVTVIAGEAGSVANNNIGNGYKTQKSVIRGLSSVQLNTSPLYVLNGVAVDNISSLNPDDVADITVLKDAASAAIWGARAANGVIVITTKTGVKNSRTKVSYSAFVNMMGKPDFDYSKSMNSSQYIQTAKETFDPVQFPYMFLQNEFLSPHERILYGQNAGTISSAQATKSLDSLSAINNISQIKDIWYRNAVTMNHTIALSGGTTDYSYYGSAAYTDTRSNTIGQSNKNYRLNFNQDYTLSKRLKISLITSLGNNLVKQARPITISDQFLPYQLFRDENGNGISMPYVQGYTPERRADFQRRSRIDLDYNPLDEINYGYASVNNLNFNVAGEVDLKLFKGLSFHGNYGYQKAPGSNRTYDDHQGYKVRRELLSMTVAPTVASTPIYYLPTTGGTFVTAETEERNWTVRNQLIYNSSLRDGKDQLNLQFGHEAREQYAGSHNLTLRGYDDNLQSYAILDYKTLSEGIYNTVPSFFGAIAGQNYGSTDARTRFSSYYGLLNYTFDGRYSIDGSWRIDHSNLFGSDNSTQNRPVWSIGAKWNLTRERFMPKLDWLNNLSLRATYGITGNSPYIGGASQYDILTTEGGGGGAIVGSSSLAGPGLRITSAANRTLNWETTSTANIGLDFELLKSRIVGSINVYRKMTDDLLGSVKLNPLTGFSSALGNIGTLRNKGIELGIQSSNIQTTDFSWNTSVTFSYNQNKLLSYTEQEEWMNTADAKIGSNYWVEYSMQSLFAYDFDGLDNTGSPKIRLADGTVTSEKNIAKPEDVKYMGTTLPVYSGGISNTFRFKQFSLTANMIYNLGHVMRKDVNQVYNGRITGVSGSFLGNLHTDFLNRWKNPGDEAFTHIPAYLSAENFFSSTRELSYYTNGDLNVLSASYLKLRDITLSYAIPAVLLRKAGIGSANLFVQGTNFMLWKANNEGIDPEYNNLESGVRIIPNYLHSYSLGINVIF